VVRKRRLAIIAAFAAVFVSGLLLTTSAGTSSQAPLPHRVILLGESGQIIRGHVGEVVDVHLGAATSVRWRFGLAGHSATVTPVFASIPEACPPVDGSGRDSASVAGTFATSRLAACDAPASTRMVQMARISFVSPGVTTVKGWRTDGGAAVAGEPPDFVFVILVER